MLTIDLPEQEFYDGVRGMFFNTKPQSIKMEHSLISVSKWESHFKKPYLPARGLPGISTYSEELFYISCMIIGNVDEHIPHLLMQSYAQTIREYIEDPHTATSVSRIGPQTHKSQIVTTELIYYWMFEFGIPLECERWHFNRLLTLIDVCNTKTQAKHGKNKMSTLESAKYRDELNKARRGEL